jgi:hypothetical protein
LKTTRAIKASLEETFASVSCAPEAQRPQARQDDRRLRFSFFIHNVKEPARGFPQTRSAHLATDRPKTGRCFRATLAPKHAPAKTFQKWNARFTEGRINHPQLRGGVYRIKDWRLSSATALNLSVFWQKSRFFPPRAESCRNDRSNRLFFVTLVVQKRTIAGDRQSGRADMVR